MPGEPSVAPEIALSALLYPQSAVDGGEAVGMSCRASRSARAPLRTTPCPDCMLQRHPRPNSESARAMYRCPPSFSRQASAAYITQPVPSR